MKNNDICSYSEYDEVCESYTLMDYHRELKYQCNQLGFSSTDSFPQYIKEKINKITIQRNKIKMGSVINTFKIGEYAIGGIIKVYINQHNIEIKALDWNTKKEVLSQIFEKPINLLEIELFIAENITTHYFADKIITWIKSMNH